MGNTTRIKQFAAAILGSVVTLLTFVTEAQAQPSSWDITVQVALTNGTPSQKLRVDSTGVGPGPPRFLALTWLSRLVREM